ncbi:MAG: pentapeptide repeat-containing protein [Bacteroidales bacterium]|nr:pentapeptide repeat-containing protein [Bacteroidales bacterium]
MAQNSEFINFSFNDSCTEYHDCVFKNSNFANLDLLGYEFFDCSFESCDFSLAQLNNTVLSNVKFINCKLLGVDFSKCSRFIFSVYFKDCILNFSFFQKNNLKKTMFSKCILKEVQFVDSDLSSAVFAHCDLTDSVFENCKLLSCDFRTAQNYSFIPDNNKIKNARFSHPHVIGLLDHLQIIIDE